MSSAEANSSESAPSPSPTIQELDENLGRRLSRLVSRIIRNSPRQENRQPESPRNRIRVIMLNASTGNMIVIEGPRDLESIFQELTGKSGVSPATKDSIEALPRVVVSEEGGECSICLEDYEVGAEACEMPCKHRFHSACIEKWLGIHGNCPLCRFLMPVEEMENKSSSSAVEEETGGENLGIDEEIISVSIWVQAHGSDSMDLDMELVPSSENTESDSQHGNSDSEANDSSRNDSMDLDMELVSSLENTDGNSGSEAHDSSTIGDMDS